MSQVASTARVAPPPNRTEVRADRFGRRRINPDDLSTHPTRKGRGEALQFFAELGVHGLTETRLRTATEDGSLRRFRIAGHNWYADRDLWDWLMSLASGGAR